MAEYIEREAAINFIKENQCKKCSDIGLCGGCAVLTAIKLFQTVPAADVAPVRHGWWTHGEGDSRWMCSLCKSKENVPTIMGKPIVWDYCPNCGAKMDGGET